MCPQLEIWENHIDLFCAVNEESTWQKTAASKLKMRGTERRALPPLAKGLEGKKGVFPPALAIGTQTDALPTKATTFCSS